MEKKESSPYQLKLGQRNHMDYLIMKVRILDNSHSMFFFKYKHKINEI
jgi:hypothetical protein